MKTFLAFALSVALLPLQAVAAESKPTVESVLSKYVTAVGGKAAVEKITSLAMEGTMEIFGTTGEFRTFQKANKAAWTFVGQDGTHSHHFDGEKGWKKNPLGVQELTPQELRGMKQMAELHLETHLTKVFPNLQFKGTETINGEEAHILESNPSAEISDRLAFSVKTGLLVEQSSRDGSLKTKFQFQDFKTVDGVQRPHSMTQTLESPEGTLDLVFKWKSIQSNKELKDELFARPQG
ncbi:MAG: hypothetical protein SFY81_13005 [Verrucomicrobiota bacterium]|nr:hypothetical protein [Verrucomicrobiota bacterium]